MRSYDRSGIVDGFLQLLLRENTWTVESHVTALENHDRGNTTHLAIHGRLDTIVDIDLADLGTPLVRLCQLVNDRHQLATGTTPGRAKVKKGEFQGEI